MDKLVVNLQLYNGYALVETIKESAGKFELPESSDKKPQKGKIIKISDQIDKSDLAVEWSCPAQVGDTIWYRNWGSEVVDFGGQDYIFVRFRDIIAGVKE